MRFGGPLATVTAIALAIGCGKPRAGESTTPAAPKRIKLAILGVESDAFPEVAAEATASLARAQVAGVDDRQVSRVSLEIVQLSIECVEPTPACYGAVARSLAADRLLFAQVARGPKRKTVIVKVTLFDAVAASPRTVEKQFPNARAATAGVDGLVAEALR